MILAVMQPKAKQRNIKQPNIKQPKRKLLFFVVNRKEHLKLKNRIS
jgi:hypothetical protein